MSEEVVGDIFGMDVVDAYVHVEACLDVVLGDAAVLQGTHCLSSTKDKGFVLGRNPTALHLRGLLLISILLILANESSGVSDRFLRVLVEITSEDVSFGKVPLVSVFDGGEVEFVLGDKVGVLLCWSSGWKVGSKVSVT